LAGFAAPRGYVGGLRAWHRIDDLAHGRRDREADGLEDLAAGTDEVGAEVVAVLLLRHLDLLEGVEVA
jgi:hypothetical protein